MRQFKGVLELLFEMLFILLTLFLFAGPTFADAKQEKEQLVVFADTTPSMWTSLTDWSGGEDLKAILRNENFYLFDPSMIKEERLPILIDSESALIAWMDGLVQFNEFFSEGMLLKYLERNKGFFSEPSFQLAWYGDFAVNHHPKKRAIEFPFLLLRNDLSSKPPKIIAADWDKKAYFPLDDVKVKLKLSASEVPYRVNLIQGDKTLFVKKVKASTQGETVTAEIQFPTAGEKNLQWELFIENQRVDAFFFSLVVLEKIKLDLARDDRLSAFWEFLFAYDLSTGNMEFFDQGLPFVLNVSDEARLNSFLAKGGLLFLSGNMDRQLLSDRLNSRYSIRIEAEESFEDERKGVDVAVSRSPLFREITSTGDFRGLEASKQFQVIGKDVDVPIRFKSGLPFLILGKKIAIFSFDAYTSNIFEHPSFLAILYQVFLHLQQENEHVYLYGTEVNEQMFENSSMKKEGLLGYVSGRHGIYQKEKLMHVNFDPEEWTSTPMFNTAALEDVFPFGKLATIDERGVSEKKTHRMNRIGLILLLMLLGFIVIQVRRLKEAFG